MTNLEVHQHPVHQHLVHPGVVHPVNHLDLEQCNTFCTDPDTSVPTYIERMLNLRLAKTLHFLLRYMYISLLN